MAMGQTHFEGRGAGSRRESMHPRPHKLTRSDHEKINDALEK
jgi:hypothetical protein